jgi:hypothetical protein
MSSRTKKFFRWTLRGAAVLAVILGCGVFYCTRPSVQRGWVLELLARQGVRAELGGVSASLFGGNVEVSGVTLWLPECKVSLARLGARVDWLALPGKTLLVRGLEAEGLELDFPEKTSPATGASGGVAGSVGVDAGGDSPWRLIVREGTPLDIAVRLGNGARHVFSLNDYSLDSAGSNQVRIETGALPAGRLSGTLQFQLQSPLRRLPDTWESVQAQTGAIAFEATLASTLPQGRPTLTLRLHSQGGDTRARLAFCADGKNENLHATATHTPGKPVHAQLQLLKLKLADLAHLHPSIGEKLPELALLTGTASLSLPRANQPLRLESANLEGTLARPGRLNAALAAFGPLRVSFEGDGEFASAQQWRLRAKSLRLHAANATATPLLDATATLQTAANDTLALDNCTLTLHANGLAAQPAWAAPFAKLTPDDWRGTFTGKGTLALAAPTPRLALDNATLTVGRARENTPVLHATLLQPCALAPVRAPAGAPFLRIDARDFPLDLATPFLNGARINGNATGTLTLAQPDTLRLRAATPAGAKLTLRNLSYTDGAGRPKLTDLHLHSHAQATFTPGDATAWEIQFDDGKIDPGDGRPLTGTLALAWRDGPERLRAKLNGDPARFLRQPLLGGFSNIATARLDLDATYARDKTCAIRLRMDKLSAQNGANAPDALALDATGNLDPAKTAITIPVRIKGKTHESDFTLTLDKLPAPARGQWNATLSGNQINVPDLQQLAAIFTPKTPAAPPATQHTPANAATTTAAPWSPWPGNATLAIKQLHIPPFTLTDATARLASTPDALHLTDATARLANGTLAAQARLARHTPGPYTFASRLALRALPFKDCIPLLAPAAANILEGRFDIDATADATALPAPTTDALLDNATVHLTATSRNGRVRIFKMDNETMRAMGDAVELAGGVADIVRGLAQTKRTGKHTAPLNAFRQMQKYLDDFPFDTARIEVAYHPRDSTKVRQIHLANDQLSITANGAITHHPGQALADSPLALHAQLNARAGMALLLDHLNLLKEGTDANGFRPGPRFELGGSINSLQNDLLQTLLEAVQNTAAKATLPLLPADAANDALETGSALLHELGI